MLRKINFSAFRRARNIMALSAVVPLALVLSVSSVTVSQVDIPAGGIVSGTVTLSAPVSASTSINLSSSKPSVAAPTSTIATVKTGSTAGFKVQGNAAGCTNISARQGVTAARQVLVYVLPPVSPESNFKLGLSKTSVAGGSSLTGTVLLAVANPQSRLVQLSSDNPNVTVPASVQLSAVEGGALTGNFPINTSVVAPSTCAVITATLGTSSSSVLLKVASISG